MSNRWIAWAAAAWLAASAALADDTVKTVKDNKFSGRVTTTATEVAVETPALTEKVPVNEIDFILYEGEPSGLRMGRQAVASGNFPKALEELEKIKDEVERAEIKQDIEFYRAYSVAKLALSGNGDIVKAGQQLVAFVKAHPNSYHFLRANETVGDLLVAAGKSAAAKSFYETVAKAPWPDYKMRANVAMGQAALADEKPAEALKYFDLVLAEKAEGELAAAQRMAAVLGKARCLAEGGKADVAVKAVEDVIAKADPENVDLLGRAYNVLGLALHKSGKSREAMFAFLHVDTLYSDNREAHAEALYHLVRVFTELRKPERAKDARTALQEQYGESRWNKAVK